MLTAAPLCAQRLRRPVDVYLAHHRRRANLRDGQRIAGGLGQREAQETRQPVVRREILQELLLCRIRLVDHRRQMDCLDALRRAPPADLPAAHAPALQALFLHPLLDHLAEIALLRARHDVIGGDIAHHAVEAAVRLHQQFALLQQLDQHLFVVGLVLTRFPQIVELRAFQQGGRVELHLVRADRRIVPDAPEILQIRCGRRAVEVGHPVGHDLESRQSQQAHGAARLFHRMPPLVQRQNIVIQ